ncbi:hypothetical protein COU76_00060 [Candidatus Peregrinibacteria bacterium CG10_big_fil_rev_8_21_14_0_10_49_10]|nr:MAG: hypothetical protein COU76_00060 [Candidatus Peregrinibacteria bacterium CG10_big_fil_rev_8_21_14_0_10_49_10]
MSTERAPQARQQKETLKAGELYKSIAERLSGEETPEAAVERQMRSVKSRSYAERFNMAVHDRQLSLKEMRKEVQTIAVQMVKNLGERDTEEAYGSTVLDSLESTLAPQRVDTLKNRFRSVQDQIPPSQSERKRVMNKAIGSGFTLPRTPQEIKKHPYFYLELGALRVRTDIVKQDIATLSEDDGNPMMAIGERDPRNPGAPTPRDVMLECKAVLEEMVLADPIDHVRTSPLSEFEESPGSKNAKASLLKIIGLLAALMGGFSLLKKANGMAAFYLAIAAMTLKPDLLQGRLKELGSVELGFTKDSRFEPLSEKYAGELTGEAGASFFREMTQSSKVRMLYAKTKGGGKKMDLNEYYDQLEQVGISGEHIALLKKMSPEDRDFLLTSLQNVRSSDAQNLLADYAREGMRPDALSKLPFFMEKKPQPTRVPSSYDERDRQIKEQFGPLGPVNS